MAVDAEQPPAAAPGGLLEGLGRPLLGLGEGVFPGWQKTTSGEREVQKSLRQALLKYQLHKDQVLFDRAYNYIKEYY
jgi:type I restriction enzyme R subunit